MPGVPAADAPTVDLGDPASLLTPHERDALRAHADALMQVLAREHVLGDIRVTILDDARMSLQHETHKQMPGTTDVLTFDLAPDQLSLLDADILICADEARRQAETRGHQVVSELMLYIVHGVLHCTGYDDAQDEGDFGARAMHQREDEILTELGLGTVYHSHSAEDAS